ANGPWIVVCAPRAAASSSQNARMTFWVTRGGPAEAWPEDLSQSERMNAQCTLAVQRRLERKKEALLAVIRTNRGRSTQKPQDPQRSVLSASSKSTCAIGGGLMIAARPAFWRNDAKRNLVRNLHRCAAYRDDDDARATTIS